MTEEAVGVRSVRRTAMIVLAILSVVFGPLATEVAAAEERIVTEAEAFVDNDGDREFDHAFEIHDLYSAVVDPANYALAHARGCTGCQAVALSFQIVLLQQPAHTIRPENLAVSWNEECTGCDAAAGAYQFVVGRGEPIRLTPTGYRQLARVRGKVASLQASGLSGPAMVARADTLADEVRAILAKQVKPIDEWTQVVIDEHRFRSVGDGPPDESSTTVTAAA